MGVDQGEARAGFIDRYTSFNLMKQSKNKTIKIYNLINIMSNVYVEWCAYVCFNVYIV